MSDASIYLKAKIYLEIKYTYTYIHMEYICIYIYIFELGDYTYIYIFSNVNFLLFSHESLFFLKKEGADGCSKQTVHNMSGDVLCYLLRVDYN